MEHEFTVQIKRLLASMFGKEASIIFEQSPLLQYLNIKTRSAHRGSKSRGSFANLYAVYVLVEDYVLHNYHQQAGYVDYEGAKFTDLLRRQRELPFGSKLQNHALNSRMNEEFKRYFPQVAFVPILRNLQTNRYWINENLLRLTINGRTYNLAKAVIDTINQYVETQQDAFVNFIATCERLKDVSTEADATVEAFVIGLLAPHVDARIFEIVSYAILKFFYHNEIIYFGFDPEHIYPENLKLYKTGRTNANDGGIDFVMRPLGRFFQVTETLEVRKYLLDIAKLEHYPISFVIKSEETIENLKNRLREGAAQQYPVNAIVERYMDAIEEIINLDMLRTRFAQVIEQGSLRSVLDEIVLQSKVEFNYVDD